MRCRGMRYCIINENIIAPPAIPQKQKWKEAKKHTDWSLYLPSISTSQHAKIYVLISHVSKYSSCFFIGGLVYATSGLDLGRINNSCEDMEICLAFKLFSTESNSRKMRFLKADSSMYDVINILTHFCYVGVWMYFVAETYFKRQKKKSKKHN